MEQEIIYRGPSVLSILGILFIALKLIGVIEWSWLWVLSPFWLPVALLLSIISIFFILAALFTTLAGLIEIFGDNS